MKFLIEIDANKSLEQNASKYFEESKKARKKIIGLKKAAIDLEKKTSQLEEKKLAPKKEPLKKRERKWFEKFHWFFTSENFLIIAGRDAKSNN